jgi:hypothetical protein
MANTLKISANVSNTIEGGLTTQRVSHRIEAIALSYSAKDSVTHTFTTNDNQSLSVSSGAILINGATQKHPITGATIAVAEMNGFILVVERAADETPPTSTAAVQLTDFCGWTTSDDAPLSEDSFLYFHNPDPASVVDSSITIKKSGTTGYRANLIVWYTPV